MKRANKNKTKSNYFMDFEYAMRQFFGDKAYHIEDIESNKKHVRQWLIKATRQMIKDVLKIETVPRHKELLVGDLEKLLKFIKSSEDLWMIIYRLYFICSRFLGYDYIQGFSYHTPLYYQTRRQNFYSILEIDKYPNDIFGKEKSSTLSKQKELVKQLKGEGYNDFFIGLIMGISEYKVKKLLKEN